jgi:hypothetical protein
LSAQLSHVFWCDIVADGQGSAIEMVSRIASFAGMCERRLWSKFKVSASTKVWYLDRLSVEKFDSPKEF